MARRAEIDIRVVWIYDFLSMANQNYSRDGTIESRKVGEDNDRSEQGKQHPKDESGLKAGLAFGSLFSHMLIIFTWPAWHGERPDTIPLVGREFEVILPQSPECNALQKVIVYSQE